MRDRAQGRALVLAHRHHAGHVGQRRRLRRHREVLGRALLEHRGGEGAVALALLDHGVDARHVRGGTRVGHDAAVAEGARAEFRAALHPAQHLPCGQALRGFRARVLDRRHADERRPALEGGTRGRVGTDVAADEEVLERRGTCSGGELAVEVQRGTQRTAGVVRRGMHEHLVEQAREQDLAVEGRVVRDTPRQAQPALAGSLAPVPQRVEGDGLERFLQRGGDVLVQGREGLVVAPRREDGVQRRDAPEVDRVLPVGSQLVERAEELAVRRGVTVRGEPHHLVLLEHVVAEEADRLAVEVAQRVRFGNPAQRLEFAVANAQHEARVALARPVEGDGEAVAEAGVDVRAQRMAQVVVGEVQARRVDRAPELLLEAAAQQRADADAFAPRLEARVVGVEHGVGGLLGGVVGEGIHVLDADTVGLEAGAHCRRGHAVGVLDAIDALLLDRRDHAAVVQQHRGRVVHEVVRQVVVEAPGGVEPAGEADDDHGSGLPARLMAHRS